MYDQKNRTMRKKNRNITPFIHLSPRLNDQTSCCERARILQRLRTTEKGKDVQLGNHQRRAQGYCKLHRCSGDRIDCNVPSYDRNHIGVEDKWRRGDPEWIGGNGGRYRRGSPHNSGREDGIESIQLGGQQEQGKELLDKEAPEWGRREPECH